MILAHDSTDSDQIGQVGDAVWDNETITFNQVQQLITSKDIRNKRLVKIANTMQGYE